MTIVPGTPQGTPASYVSVGAGRPGGWWNCGGDDVLFLRRAPYTLEVLSLPAGSRSRRRGTRRDAVPVPEFPPGERGVRRDNRLIDRIPYAGPVPAESPIFGTDTAIVVGLAGRVVAYPRSSTELAPVPVEIDAPVYAFDVAMNGVAVARPDGTVDLFRAG
jgi:hypothetical protein